MTIADSVIGAVTSGGASLFKRQAKWRLYDIDHDVTVEGQFAPLGLTRDVGSNIGETQSLNRQDTIIQWLSGTGESITFDAMLFADNILYSILEQMQALENLTKRDPDLRRPPVCRFTYGREVAMQCIVESVGGIRYGEARPGGKLRSVMFTVSLRKYVPYSPTATEEPTETVFRPARQNETYEVIAERAYGNAIKGVNLRNYSPSLDIILPVAESVAILEPTDDRIVVGAYPASIVFAANLRDTSVFTEMNAARSGDYMSTVLVS